MTLEEVLKHLDNMAKLKKAFTARVEKPKTFWQSLATEIGSRLIGGLYLPALVRVGWSALIVLSTAFLSRSLIWVSVISGLVLLVGAGKQFVWNARFVPYSTKRSAIEFVGYVGGLMIAWGLVVIRALIG